MKKIMFNDKYGLTQAVLDGRKTQTRRIIPENLFQECRSNGFLEADCFNSQWKEKSIELLLAHSTYKIGEEVAVAQSYRDEYSVWEILKLLHPEKKPQVGDLVGAGWNNKMFVRADLMPHRIRITNVRVERLQDISDEDCLREGIHVDDKAPKGVPLYKYIAYSPDADPDRKKKRWWYNTPREAFAALIDKTCGRGTWDSNPFVAVYDFILIK